ncbi:MAG TPA: tryptophan synthase subunit alpha [Candidatus Limnocylindrales bacterium]|nr:tryptophan synthase subunit alpha [Candidatus Limnocylindrales bacterium]
MKKKLDHDGRLGSRSSAMTAISSGRIARSLSRRPGLVVYVTCGDPDMATTRAIVLAAIKAGADVIELGVPFSDPVADGPVIQRASERALKHGTSLQDVLDLAAEVRGESDAGLVVFSYLNPVLRFGLERFCIEAEKAGVDGALITDLTVEEADEYRRLMAAHHLDTIFLAAPTSPDQRLKKIAQACRGFVYAVSRTGVTGTQKQLAGDAAELVKRIRKHTKLPVAVGFGVSSAPQFAEVGSFADAAVVGSAVVQAIERNPGREAEAVAGLIRELKSGAAQPATSHV